MEPESVDELNGSAFIRSSSFKLNPDKLLGSFKADQESLPVGGRFGLKPFKMVSDALRAAENFLNG